jgi:hypothetical protein
MFLEEDGHVEMNIKTGPSQQQGKRTHSPSYILDANDVGIQLDIFPGLHFQSAYEDENINAYSTHIIRLALIMTIVQIAVAIMGCFSYETSDIVVNMFTMAFYILALRLCIRCVRKRNKQTMCFGITEVTSLKMYIYYLYLSLAGLLYGLIRFIIWITQTRTVGDFNDSGLARSSAVIGGDNTVAEYTAIVVITLFVYASMILMNFLQILYAHSLNDIIKKEIKDQQRAAGIVINKLRIFPGFHLISSYTDPEVMVQSTKVIRIGFALSIIQIVRAAIAFFSWGVVDIVISLINIAFYFLVIRYAIRMVKKLNKATLFLGISSLQMYINCLFVSIGLVLFGFIRFILWVKDVRSKEEVNDSKFAQSSPVGGRDVVAEYTAVVVVYIIIFTIMFILNIAALFAAFRLKKIFTMHVVPL